MCLGIVTGLYFRPGSVFTVTAVTLTVAGFLLSLFFNRYLYNVVFGCVVSVSLFLTGLFLYVSEKSRLSDLNPSLATYTGTLSEYPEEKEKTFSLVIRLNSELAGTKRVPLYGSMLIHLRKENSVTDFIPGDIMVIKCSPAPIMNRGNPYEFDYKFFMENQGIRYFSFADRNDIISHYRPEHIKLRYRALIIREKIIDMYRSRGITGERLALVAAITLGQKRMLEPEQKQSFIRAGIMHIMAVSGLHAVILSLFIYNILFFMKGKLSLPRVIMTVIFLWLFAYVTGLTPSVLRATFMYTFLQAGNLMQRKVNSLNSVMASAFILLLIKPSSLFDAGFLLSYSAVIFIIVFYQELYIRLDFKNRLADKIWQSAAVTITAQAGTLPLTISLFNRFPTWFLLTNIIIVPLSSVLIIIGCIIPVVYPLKFLSFPLAKILSFLTGVTAWLTEKASALPLSTIDGIGLGSVESLLLFILIFVTSKYFLDRKSMPVIFPVIIFFLFITAGTLKDLDTKLSNELIVYNSIGSSSVGIRNGKTLWLYTDTIPTLPEIVRHTSSLGLETRSSIIESSCRYIRAGRKKILITGYLSSRIMNEVKPDIVIMTGKTPGTERRVDFPDSVSLFVVTPEVKESYYLKNWLVGLKSCRVYSVKKSGTWRMKL